MNDNICYERNGYVYFILNDVEMMNNPREGDKYNRNFSGERRTITTPSGSFKTDERFCNIVVPPDMVEKFTEHRIKMWTPREPDEDGYMPFFTKLKIKFNPNTTVKLVVPGKRPVDLSEETISVVDDMRVRSIDVELGRGKEPNQEGFYSLWIRTMYINQDVPNDPFAKKYEDVPFDVDDPDDPFAGGV